MFDSHCHLTDIDDPDAVITQASLAGVSGMLTCGYHEASNRSVLELSTRWRGLSIAIGLHPWYAHQPLEPVLELIERHRPAAVGECGLEGTLGPEMPGLVRQRQVFLAQLDLARSLDMPVTVHSRRAGAEVLACLLDFPGLRGALHAFSGSIQQLRPLVERGWMIGLTGAVTRPNARRVRELARGLPLRSLLLETDAPAIGLEGVPAGLVRPQHLVLVAEAVAACRGLSASEIIQATSQNARELFGEAALGMVGPSRADGMAHPG